jgi:hypothetical protein
MMMRDIYIYMCVCLLPFLTICCSSLGELGLLVFAVQNEAHACLSSSPHEDGIVLQLFHSGWLQQHIIM